MAIAASIRRRLHAGETITTLWCDIGSVAAAEIMAEARPDAVIFDLQHGLWDRASLFNGFAAIRGKSEPIVRLAANNPTVIGEALDLGAAGIIVPLIETAEEAEAVVAAAKFPPKGHRSAGGARPMLEFATYAGEANRSLMVGVMIETAKGLKNAAAIAAVPGVDLIFIGPGDLSLSLGEFPKPGKKHEQAMQTILAICKKAKVPCGLFTMGADDAIERARQGFQFVLLGNDFDFLLSASQGAAAQFAHHRRKTSRKGKK